MRAWQMTFVAAGAALSINAPAVAQQANDVRCLMASNLFSKAAKDPKARQLAEAGKYFYLGRVSGRFTEQQLRVQMQTQTKSITQANDGNVMTACTRQMQSGAAMIERVGKQLATGKK